ncbi:metallophosphoesterase [Neiella marina]|uniref:Metallophosphoesterase n=1 Tax=Neiella holothuriorum TaxID=2870530 RepID=A0ABS7EJU3_9GAMM|nr:metallophosphoesterase [Neiella holothuriorum]MBW8192595.1 metallophosphoesterase [Neiella holothuriorum]
MFLTMLRGLSVSLILMFAVSIPAQADTIKTDAEVIVIGDIHGAFEEVTALLQELGVINDKLDWIGGKRHLVSLGDLVDRGKDSRRVIELMMRLQQQAEAAGGGYSQILGNHEIMLMTGDYRYVSEAEFASYSDLASTKQRQQLFKQYSKLFSNQSDLEAQFNASFPTGFTGLMKAFSPQGEMGKWLRQHGRAVVKVNNQVYVHGGLSKDSLKHSIEELNQDTQKALKQHQQAFAELLELGVLPFTLNDYSGESVVRTFIESRNAKRQPWFKSAQQFIDVQESLLFSSTGPFWYRGNAYCPELLESYTVEQAQQRYDIDHIVVGHSVKYRRLVSRVGGAVILADTGMLTNYYGGTPSALRFGNEHPSGHHLKHQFSDTIVAETERFRHNPNSMSDSDVEAFLKTAEIVSNKPIGSGITRSRVLVLKQGDLQTRASFKTINDSDDSYKYELAAYKLDRLLGQHLIPPVVKRTIGGRTGAVQLWVENVIDDNHRNDNDIAYQGMCEEVGWTRLMLNFDTLIYNIDRNNGNILWDEEFFGIFIDHSQSFNSLVRVPKMYRRSTFLLSKMHKQRLQSLTLEQLNKELGDDLKSKQIKAIIKRRDFILDKAK